jgi:hypothetical protein
LPSLRKSAEPGVDQCNLRDPGGADYQARLITLGDGRTSTQNKDPAEHFCFAGFFVFDWYR